MVALKAHYCLLLILLLCFNGQCFVLLDLPSVNYSLKPRDNYCNGDETTLQLLILVHSAPDHSDLRQTIRDTWGANSSDVRPVFLLGQSEEFNGALVHEHEHHGDLVQATFKDSYRNMTYKHILGYKWTLDHCTNAKFVLKADDDQAVDTLHLPHYLEEYVDEKTKPFLLGIIIRDQPVQREPSNKWFVTREEYQLDNYPVYLAGWAYVTNIVTMELLLKVSWDEPYFWIDDVFVTGSLVQKLPTESIAIYDWRYGFMNEHVQHRADILQGTMFTPELMVASDVNSEEIRHLHKKFFKCHEKKCYRNFIYDSTNGLVQHLKPAKTFNKSNVPKKSEL